MPQSKRSLMIKVASAVSAVAVVASLAAVIVTRAPASHAGASVTFKHNTTGVKMVYHGSMAAFVQKVNVANAKAHVSAGHIPTRANSKRGTYHVQRELNPRGARPISSNPSAPKVAPTSLAPATAGAGPLNGQHIPEWNGLSELDNDFTNGFEVSPAGPGPLRRQFPVLCDF